MNPNEVFFLGIVDDINDPKKLGRVKVRQINEYSDRVESNDIPWALPVMPASSASYLGIGDSPTGIQVGSRVIGFFLDGQSKSKPVILGTYPIILKGNETDHSLSQYARGNGPIKKEYLSYEPKSEYAAQYPFNKTTTTRGGHVIEIDDTPKSERIHFYHKSGSYIEMFPDGKMVTKSSTSNFDICMKDKNIISDDGDINILSNNKDLNLQAYKNINMSSADGDVSISSEGDLGLVSKGGIGIFSEAQSEIKSKGSLEISSDGSIEMKSGSNINIECNNLNIKGKVSITGTLKVNGRDVQLK